MRIGDRVVIRPSCVAQLAREWDVSAKAISHVPCKIVEALSPDKKVRRWCFLLRWPARMRARDVWAWPIEVRLADGATERADVRFEARAKEIEAMKRARRKTKKGARKS